MKLIYFFARILFFYLLFVFLFRLITFLFGYFLHKRRRGQSRHSDDSRRRREKDSKYGEILDAEYEEIE